MQQAAFDFDDSPDERLAVLPTGQTIPVLAIEFLWALEAKTGRYGCYALDEANAEEMAAFWALEASCELLMRFEAASYHGARHA